MDSRINSLDGWRGLCIPFVLAGHLLPLGPASWKMNAAVAASGMEIFFILSGFLITNILIKDKNIIRFMIRRFMRIIPLAWLFIVITLLLITADKHNYLPHILFIANWEPITLTYATSHFWSLCVEMQLYILIAIMVATLGDKAFVMLPILCVLVSVNRYLDGVEIAINTYYRIDEILAGCILALIYKQNSLATNKLFKHLNPIVLLPLLILSSHPEGSLLSYIRPYIAMLLIGSTLFGSPTDWANILLKNRFLLYSASISYALYIIHGGLRHTWLGEGETIEKYMKRPVLFIVIFLLAHISTFYYECHWIKFSKHLVRITSINKQKIH